MPDISDSLVIRGRRIKNRIAMLPMVTFSFRGDDGNYFGRQHIEHYKERARGGAGLIIVQSTNVMGASSATGMWTPGSVEALTKIAANASSYGASAMLQLSCNNGADIDINALTEGDIRTMQQEMKHAAVQAHAIGFHGVEFHCAHGYTLCRFLDATQNRRSDEFGSSAVNRGRIVTDMLPDIRRDTDETFIVSVRMGAYLPTRKDGLELAGIFESSGIDMLDVSYGMHIPEGPVPEDFPFGPVTHSAYVFKQALALPVIGLYEIRTEEQVRLLISGGYADFVGIGRGMLADPDFANHVLKSEDVNTCFTCKKCSWFTDHTQCPAQQKLTRKSTG